MNRLKAIIVDDERLAEFAQTLNDALTAQAQPARGALDLGDDPEPMMRTLEVARERTGAAGAIALYELSQRR